MTRKEMRSIIRWFKSNIGLHGWTIDVTISGVPPEELTGDIPPDERKSYCGRSIVYTQFHRAVVWIHPEGHEDKLMIDNQEETLLHELVHCWWADVGLEETGQQCEWANNRLAAVLLKQYRSDVG